MSDSSSSTQGPRYCGQWHRIDPRKLDTSSLSDGPGATHCLYAYRTIACVYVIVMFLVENDDPNTLYQFFQYLTHWGARMIVTYYITSVAALIWLRCNKSKVKEVGDAPYNTERSCCGSGWTWTARFRTILFTMCFCSQLVVVLIYWLVLHDWETGTVNFIDLHVHVFLFLIIYTEFMITRFSMTGMHMLYVVALALLYTITNGIATAAKGSPVYDIITWDSAGTLLWFMIAYTIMGGAFFVAWGLQVLRDNHCCRSKAAKAAAHARIEEGDVEMGSVATVPVAK